MNRVEPDYSYWTDSLMCLRRGLDYVMTAHAWEEGKRRSDWCVSEVVVSRSYGTALSWLRKKYSYRDSWGRSPWIWQISKMSFRDAVSRAGLDLRQELSCLSQASPEGGGQRVELERQTSKVKG